MPALEQMVDVFAADPPERLEQLKISLEPLAQSFSNDWSRLVQPLSRTGITLEIEMTDNSDSNAEWDEDHHWAAQPAAPLRVALEESEESEESDAVSLYSHPEKEIQS